MIPRVTKSVIVMLLACGFAEQTIALDPIQGIPTVVDGDTLEVHGTRIRMYGIDAPESSQICTENTSKIRCGQIAANKLDEKINRRTVVCNSVDRDRYNRMVAECFLGKENLNKWLASNGLAVAYVQYSDKYLPDQQVAKTTAIRHME